MWTSGKQESIGSRKGGLNLERWNSGTEGEFLGRIHRIGRTVGEYTGADHPVVSVYIRLPLSSVPAFQINSFREVLGGTQLRARNGGRLPLNWRRMASAISCSLTGLAM